MGTGSKAIISNGFSKFEVAYSAEEAHRAGRLERYLTGAYPAAFWRRLLGWRRWSGGVGRFLDRATRLPDSVVSSFAVPEFLYLFAVALPPSLRSWGDIRDRLLVRAFEAYGASAVGVVSRATPATRIYHYRSGFGGRSIDVARDRGMVLLCEHSIAHPATLAYLVDNGGRLPAPGEVGAIGRFQQYLNGEIAQSDYVVANSDFVKKSMIAAGHPAEKVFVLYRGTDDSFISFLDSGEVPEREHSGGPLRLLYAGSFGRRKGAKGLRAAIDLLKDKEGWTLTLAGPVEQECAADYERLLADPRVRGLGRLSRQQMACAMRQADVFVFPSLAEGSARVVFEALAAGCYVVTTENSGSIVGTAAHGIIVEPENAAQLADAIATLIADRGRVREGGLKNAALIRSDFRQSAYGDKLIALYDQIAGNAKG